MKIEVHDNGVTVTKGWFRKQQAEVYREYGDWRYTDSRVAVGWWLSWQLKRAYRRYQVRNVWKPLSLPKAMVHE